MLTKILVIEDEEAIASLVQMQLEVRGYEVEIARNGSEGLRKAYSWQPNLILLDIMMPGMDGWAVCERLRELSHVPIIFVTSLGQENQVVRGLIIGGDDYLIKPFSPKELLARIEAVLRRSRAQDSNISPQTYLYKNGALKVDLKTHEIELDGEPVNLTPMEFKLLSALVRGKGQVVKHERLLAEVWGSKCASERQYLKLYIWYLRNKLEENPSKPQLILTERGIGYRLIKNESKPNKNHID